MKPKLLIVLLISVLLMTMLPSCGGASKSLAECGEEVISVMADMVENEDFKSLYHIPSEYDDTIQKLREGDYGKCKAVYELTIPEEELMEAHGSDIEWENFSEELYEYLCSTVYVSFATRINRGYDATIASSIYAAQKTFVSREADGNKVYVYTFEKGCPITVTFVAGEDGSVRATGYFIINDDFVTDDESSIEKSCKALGIEGVTVTKK